MTAKKPESEPKSYLEIDEKTPSLPDSLTNHYDRNNPPSWVKVTKNLLDKSRDSIRSVFESDTSPKHVKALQVVQNVVHQNRNVTNGPKVESVFRSGADVIREHEEVQKSDEVVKSRRINSFYSFLQKHSDVQIVVDMSQSKITDRFKVFGVNEDGEKQTTLLLVNNHVLAEILQYVHASSEVVRSSDGTFVEYESALAMADGSKPHFVFEMIAANEQDLENKQKNFELFAAKYQVPLNSPRFIDEFGELPDYNKVKKSKVFSVLKTAVDHIVATGENISTYELPHVVGYTWQNVKTACDVAYQAVTKKAWNTSFRQSLFSGMQNFFKFSTSQATEIIDTITRGYHEALGVPAKMRHKKRIASHVSVDVASSSSVKSELNQSKDEGEISKQEQRHVRQNSQEHAMQTTVEKKNRPSITVLKTLAQSPEQLHAYGVAQQKQREEAHAQRLQEKNITVQQSLVDAVGKRNAVKVEKKVQSEKRKSTTHRKKTHIVSSNNGGVKQVTRQQPKAQNSVKSFSKKVKPVESKKGFFGRLGSKIKEGVSYLFTPQK